MSHFDAIGGEPALRVIIGEFVERMVNDPMIGFFFARTDRRRLEEKEYEHAAQFLGAPGVVYTGRPIADVHRVRRIFGGHFARRRELLRQVMVAHGVPEDVQHAWLAHMDSLRGEVTGDLGSECR